MKAFSIIIPVYNGQDVVGPALDSIYSQDLPIEDFEVICVDDCSPSMDTFEMLNGYVYKGQHPTNLKVYRHEVNKRQGGARNTALNHAEGEWILYLDQDDFFIGDSLKHLRNSLKEYRICDVVMFDYQLKDLLRNCSVHHIYKNQGFNSEEITGSKFIQKYPIPWTPWCYAYKREFLIAHQILFAENVRFEDVDYVIISTLLSKSMVFLPIDVYCHVDSGYNTSFVGNNRFLIEDLFKISIRIKDVAEDFMMKDREGAQAAMNHHIYHYQWLLKSLLWRLSYSQILELLNNYTPYEKAENKLIKFTRKHPQVYAALAQVARPFLLAAVWMRNKLK